jgi:hypothetical protein
MTGHSAGKKMYKACKPLHSDSRSAIDNFADIPCGVCPVMKQCSPTGVISPATCQYYSQWLSLKANEEALAKGDEMLTW